MSEPTPQEALTSAETVQESETPAPAESVPQKAASPPKGNAVRRILSACWNFLGEWSWAALLFGAVFLIGYYTLFPSRGFFHSDTTDTLMWAVASNESSSLFNPDFSYACLLPFGTSLIMWALIPFFGVTMTTHVIGMFIFFLCFTVSLIWLLHNMKWGWGWISFAVFVELMICSASEKLREIYWGHTIYYSLGVLFLFVGLALLFTCLDKFGQCDAAKPEDKKNAKIWLITAICLLCMWFILTGMNQIITIAIFSLPMLAAVFSERWLDRNVNIMSRPNWQALLLFGVMAVGMVLGYLITAVAAKGIVAGYEGAFSNYSPMEEWPDHVRGFAQAWNTLLGASMMDGEPLMSVKSVRDLLVVITGIILLVVPVLALLCYKKYEDRKMRLLVLAYWFMCILLMMGYIMGRLSSANWRLSPVVAMSAVVTVAFVRWSITQVEWQRVMSLLMIPVTLVCTMSAFTIAKMPSDNTDESHLYRLAAGLEEHGLNYGYATFWNANGLTVVADSRVKCRSVNIEENGCFPYIYQGCGGWYQNQPGQERYFLLMSGFEHDLLLGKELDERKTDEFEIDGYFVWVFNDNLF